MAGGAEKLLGHSGNGPRLFVVGHGRRMHVLCAGVLSVATQLRIDILALSPGLSGQQSRGQRGRLARCGGACVDERGGEASRMGMRGVAGRVVGGELMRERLEARDRGCLGVASWGEVH